MDNYRPNLAMRTMRTVLSRSPIRSGLTPLSFNRVSNSVFARAGKAPLTATMRNGTTIEVDGSDYHGRILYLFGTNDPKVSITTNALLRPGDVFLDIGANYSTIGILAAESVGSSGRVHLFEPQSHLAERVRRAIRTGGHTNVELHQIGLMDVDGSFTIRGPAAHSGMATFVEHEMSEDFEVIEECQVRAIDGYAGPLVEGRRFGAKLDIEGSEPLIMPWILAQPNLRFLVFEAAHHHRDLYDSVIDAGLPLYGLNQDPLRMRTTRVDSFEEMRRFHDFVAIRGLPRHDLPKVTHPRTLSRLLD